jgi:hypothetical protein
MILFVLNRPLVRWSESQRRASVHVPLDASGHDAFFHGHDAFFHGRTLGLAEQFPDLSCDSHCGISHCQALTTRWRDANQ